MDGDKINPSEFDHWAGVASTELAAAGLQRRSSYSPPDYPACIAAQAEDGSPSRPRPAAADDAQLKTQCKQEYEGLRDPGHPVPHRSVDPGRGRRPGHEGLRGGGRQVLREGQKKQSFQTDKETDFSTSSKQSRMRSSTIPACKSTGLSQAPREGVQKATTVTQKEVETTTTRTRPASASPPRAISTFVLTKTRPRANQAKTALEYGHSWSTVIKKYSIDQASRTQAATARHAPRASRRSPSTTRSSQAARATSTGPVKTQFGYYVFEVTKVTEPKSQQTLEEAEPAIRHSSSSRADEGIHDFIKDLEEVEGRKNCRQRLRWSAHVQERAEAQDEPADHPAWRGPRRALPRRAAGRRRAASPLRGAPPSQGFRRCRCSPSCTLAVTRPAISGRCRLDALTRRLRVDAVGSRAGRARSSAYGRGGLRARRRRRRGDDAKLLDELGDVLFQVRFLSLLMEERGAATSPPWPTIAATS